MEAASARAMNAARRSSARNLVALPPQFEGTALVPETAPRVADEAVVDPVSVACFDAGLRLLFTFVGFGICGWNGLLEQASFCSTPEGARAAEDEAAGTDAAGVEAVPGRGPWGADLGRAMRAADAA